MPFIELNFLLFLLCTFQGLSSRGFHENTTHTSSLTYLVHGIKHSKRQGRRSLHLRPGGCDCFSFSAFSLYTITTRVYWKREHRTLNLTFLVFLNLTREVGASDLELDILEVLDLHGLCALAPALQQVDVLGVLLDLHGLCVLAPALQQEVLDLARHGGHLEKDQTSQALLSTDYLSSPTGETRLYFFVTALHHTVHFSLFFFRSPTSCHSCTAPRTRARTRTPSTSCSGS